MVKTIDKPVLIRYIYIIETTKLVFQKDNYMTEQEAMKYPLNAKHKPNKKHKDPVIVVCYREREHWDRQKAIAFYMEGMLACSGSEAERYTEVVRQLKAGRKVASDGVS